ncbi:hypothetical protein F0562_011143 [Nyssa sinensis]|uniref:DUF7815 domain-containing protein n=1 Tax=Nyssa sinensis TaxID=561372 RepID=A0A5J5A2Q3_9ASTE|nr:hypothetical protein F0562_011143 [Nyssa sinensis]
MIFEIPMDLIHQVQISLREDAGLSFYDPNDPTLPALPSLAESIAGFDPSPSYLRCKHCKGRLLRGLQSVICVYCGKQQSKEVPPDPIAFKLTYGYQWLLQSLDLDGSETVGPSVEENELSRGKSPPKDEISLSDLLNLEITWPVELEKPETSLTDKVPVQSKSSLNLTGVDLDNFFSESKSDTVFNVFEEQPVFNKKIENIEINAFVGQENLDLFQNVQPSETAVRFSEDKNGDLFTGWEADFQSAGNQNECLKSSNLFIGSTGDLSSHHSVLGPGKDIKDGKPREDSATSITNSWIQDDLWNNSNSTVSYQAEQFDDTVKAKDVIMADSLNNPSSTSVDWFQDGQWQIRSTNAPDTKTISEDDDSFDEWNDLTSSNTARGSSKNSLKQSVNHIAAADEQTSEINLFSSTNNIQEMDSGNFSQPDLFSGSLSNHNGSAEATNMQLEVSASKRMADAKIDFGGNVGQAAKDDDVFSGTTESKDDAELLFSQMHDLSFMLQSNLSVPSKSDGLTSFSQD